jgi:hypothetical protein
LTAETSRAKRRAPLNLSCLEPTHVDRLQTFGFVAYGRFGIRRDGRG